jgi:hypothetical protein
VKNNHDKLFYKYLDGRLSEVEKSELNNLLRKDNEACERLKLLATVSEGLSEYSYNPQNKVTNPSLKYVPWLISLAASIVAVLSFLKHEAKPDSPGPEVYTPQPPFYALLVDQAGAEFEDGAGPDQVKFNKGLYHLDDGVIHLKFSNGVDTVMRAPASFAIRNDYNIRLDHGDVRAIVPTGAEGFTVSSPSIDYEDRGTEFAISVDGEKGSSTLHVIDGQVDARNPKSNELLSSVFEGQSTEFSGGELISVATPDLSKFPSPNSIGYLRWQEQHSFYTNQSDELIGYFPFFEEPKLKNYSTNPIAGHGEIHGARWVTGRWPGKKALLFDRDNDYVEFNVTNEFDELSMSTWINIDRFDQPISSIIVSNDWDVHGDFYWHMNRQGNLWMGYRGDKRFIKSYTQKIPTGQWIHLAGSVSIPKERVRLYLNGDLIGYGGIDPSSYNKMVPGMCRMGNWGTSNVEERIKERALRGKIDQFSIWQKELTHEEVEELVELGKISVLWAMSSQ